MMLDLSDVQPRVGQMVGGGQDGAVLGKGTAEVELPMR